MSSISIDKSRPYYDPKDVHLFECDAPSWLCAWGSCCLGFPLMATTKRRIRLLEDAAANPKDNTKRNKLIEAYNSGYCGKGVTGGTIGNLVVAGALDQVGGDVPLGGLYASGKVLSVHEVIVGDDSGSFTSALKAACCGQCMNCNDAYVVREATKSFLYGPEQKGKSDTAVLLQPEAVARRPKAVTSGLML